MKYIEKKNGYVYLVEEHDAAGRFKTYYNMGKDIDDPMWNEEKPRKTKKSED